MRGCRGHRSLVCIRVSGAIPVGLDHRRIEPAVRIPVRSSPGGGDEKAVAHKRYRPMARQLSPTRFHRQFMRVCNSGDRRFHPWLGLYEATTVRRVVAETL
jgi:hypothetical protein